jgi:hypothetical protein
VAKTLLLISQRPEDLEFATEVAAVAELTVLPATSAMEGATLIANGDVSIILADTSTEAQYLELENSIQEKVGLFSDKINANAIHFLSSATLEEVPYLIRSPLFGHFISRNYGDPKAAGSHYGKIVRATLADRAFGLGLLLAPTAKVQIVKLASTSQKQEVVEAVRNYLVSAKFQTRMASVVANAVDELLMNAMFDAPSDEFGKPTLANTSRATHFVLEGKNQVEMHLGFDGNYVGISAIDQFGSLDKNKLLSHISKIYTEEEYKVKTSVAGAGIGLATVYRSGGSFFFVSESSSRTEVTVFFRRTDSFRDFKDQFRFISTQFYF